MRNWSGRKREEHFGQSRVLLCRYIKSGVKIFMHMHIRYSSGLLHLDLPHPHPLFYLFCCICDIYIQPWFIRPYLFSYSATNKRDWHQEGSWRFRVSDNFNVGNGIPATGYYCRVNSFGYSLLPDEKLELIGQNIPSLKPQT